MIFLHSCSRALSRQACTVRRALRPAPVAVACLLGVWLSAWAAQARATPLTLAQAERQMTQRNPALAAASQSIGALEHQAVAASQLPDPHLSLDAVNLPTNSFSLTQQGMTMLSVGVSQSFPPSGKLELEGDKFRALAGVQHGDRDVKHIQLLFGLRQAWVNAVYAIHALKTVQRQIELAQANEHAALASYRSGSAPQSDVLRAQLASAELLNDRSALAADETAALAQISELLGTDGKPEIDPNWPRLSAAAADDSRLSSEQPLIRVAQAKVKTARIGVEIAKKNFLPQITVGASYGKSFFPGSPNFFSAGVSMTLPIFSSRRLDAELDSARAEEMRARYDEQDQRLVLLQQIRAAAARERSLQEKWERAQQKMLPLARAAFDSTLTAYTNGRASMSDVLKAQQAGFAIELESLQYRRDLLITQAQLDELTAPAEE